jgi:hypothetical protein
MKRVLFLTVLLAIVAIPAAATVTAGTKNVTDHGCVSNMDTSGCFSEPTTTGYKFVPGEPTILTCKASGTQRCKTCNPIYTANGSVYAYECGPSTEDASCTCSLQTRGGGCNLTGSCVYTDNY